MPDQRLRFPMPLFPLPEHKIEVFVRFCPPKPSFSGFSSTKSAFLCAFTRRNPSFQASRAQNRHFCALLLSETLVFRPFEHKIGVFVRFCQQVFPDYGFYGLPASSIFPMAIRHSAASLLPQRPGQQHFPDGALPRLRLSQGAPPRRPGQQQTSSGGEKYSGLASNLAHLGRIC